MSKYLVLPKCFYAYPSVVLSLAYHQLLLWSCKVRLSLRLRESVTKVARLSIASDQGLRCTDGSGLK